MFENFVIISVVLCALVGHSLCWEQSKQLDPAWSTDSPKLYSVEGSILPPNPLLQTTARWPADISLSIGEGKYLGFVRSDGYFVISGVPPGSYVLYAHHADIAFQPVRVHISSAGKIRARRLSHINTALRIRLPYPLQLKPGPRRRYFRIREQWNILEYMLNPMVLLMVLPLLVMLLLPRLINDPETKREIENIQFPKMPTSMPDLSDALISFLSGKQPVKDKKPVKAIPNKKRY